MIPSDHFRVFVKELRVSSCWWSSVGGDKTKKNRKCDPDVNSSSDSVRAGQEIITRMAGER